jgi:hypothetical protein
MQQKKLRKVVGLLFLFLMVMSVQSQAVVGSCTEGTWTNTLTDSRGQTTYTVTAPCVVEPNVEFDIVISATDNTWPSTSVGGTWAILDNGSSLVEGFWITTDANGKWSYTKKHKISTVPNEHTISFRYRDFGNGQSGMFWDPIVTLSGITTLRSNLPPVVDPLASVAVTTENQSVSTITGTASDPEGQPLTYHWLELGPDSFSWTEVLQYKPLNADGTAPLNLGELPPLAVGEHTFKLEVNDGTLTASDIVTVTVENTAPVCNIVAPSNGRYPIDQPLDLMAEYFDFDGDVNWYAWTLSGWSVALREGPVFPGGPNVTINPYELPLGPSTLTLTITDSSGQTCSVPVDIEIYDGTAPLMNPVPSQSMLWPVNGELKTVTIATNAVDNIGGPVTLNAQVTSNQPSQIDKNGNVIPDFTITNIDQSTGVITSQLRASRAGYAGDRLYTVTIKATDQSGNSSKNDVIIKVPHDNGRN